MKPILIALFLFNISPLFGQIDIDISFYNECKSTVTRLEYEVFDMQTKETYLSNDYKIKIPSTGIYFLHTQIPINADSNYVGYFSMKLNVKNNETVKDTLWIPQIRFTTEGVLHSTYWNYFNCDKLCQGDEKDFYQNGNKRLEGKFITGKPIEMTEYREDGTKEAKYWFKVGFMDYNRIEYFDKDGKLQEYEIHNNKKKRTIKKIYNSKGKFLRKEIEKHYIEKIF